MGLMFPEDLAAWQRWQRGRHVVRRARDLMRRPVPASPMMLHRRGADPGVLFALDATTPTALASVLEPLAHLGDVPAAVLAPADVSAQLPGEWTVTAVGCAAVPATLRAVRAVVSAGHYLPVGHAAFLWVQALGARYVVVQHGLLTPFMAPLPPGAHLLAFSDRDADFWRSGRADVTGESVGSQLLWKAAAATARAAGTAGAPIFLGQLHGAELPRRISAATATGFCRETGALYRPHPAEVDRLSRFQHALWRRRGIRFADPGPLSASTGPVVSIFSTGVLEAAAAGRDAWVTCVRPPAWVREFWDRYELAEWGSPPTAPPEPPAIEPAKAIADAVLALAEGGRP
ncbi:RNA-binding protein [Microbacterium panaciterrae]|uniref:RNA-binding protein n=1 Tax=Microbacterium panaciterrae TaxID=985759 RepID=A0ABP8PEP2_9MICO